MLFINPMETEIEGAMELFSFLLPEDFDAEKYGWELMAAMSEDGEPMGILGFSEMEIGLEINWFMVHPDKRMDGIGGQMIDKFLVILNEEQIDLPIQMRVDRIFSDERSEEIWEDFYHFFNCYPYFEISFSHNLYSIDSNTRKNSVLYHKLIEKYKDVASDALCFFELPQYLQKKVIYDFIKKGYIYGDYEEFLEDCIEELCRVEVNKEGECKAAVFVTKGEGNALNIAFLYGKEAMKIMKILGCIFTIIDKNYSEIEFRMEVVNKQSEGMIKKIFPEIEAVGEQWIAEWNYGVPLTEILDDEDFIKEIFEEYGKYLDFGIQDLEEL